MNRRNLSGAGALLVIFMAVCSQPTSGGDDAADILKRLDKKYKTIADITVFFRQEVHYGVTGAEQSFRGKMYMKKGNKYRVELEDQTIVTDGKSVWSYSKANNQVIIDAYKETPGSFSPDRVMVDIPAKFSPIVLGKESIGSAETTIMKLTPKEKKSNLSWMKVWVDEDEYLMRRIQLLDVSDNLTTYFIDSLRLNQNIPEGTFTFEAPPNTERIDLR